MISATTGPSKSGTTRSRRLLDEALVVPPVLCEGARFPYEPDFQIADRSVWYSSGRY